jgi:ABC-2 type transport system ATP-binding protein
VSGTPEELKSGLEGDTVHVELADCEGGAARRALDRLPDIRAAELDGNALRVHARDGAVAMPALLAALDSQGARAASLTLARPSLDEVYLRYTGRRFESVRGGQGQDNRGQEATA